MSINTITPMYNTHGEKVFSFHTYIENQPTNNKTHAFDCNVLSAYAENRLAIYKGDNAGFFLVVMHENEPVDILMSAFEKKTILDYLSDCESKADSNFRFESETLTTMIAIHYKYDDNVCLNESALLRLTKNQADFLALDDVYQSMYQKFADYMALDRKYFEPLDFIENFNDDELNVFKFTMISALPDCNFSGSLRSSMLYAFETDLQDNCFMKFGISDNEVDAFWQAHKIHAQYFIKAYRTDKKPSVYYEKDGFVESYLKKEDELSLYRSRYHQLLKDNYDYVIAISEPEDKG